MKTVSLVRTVKNDYLAFLLACGGPIFLLVAVVISVLGFIPSLGPAKNVDPELARLMLLGAGTLTAVLGLLLVLRISGIKALIQTGTAAQATVDHIGFFKDRGRVEFHYPHNGRSHRRGVAVMKNKQTQALAPGDEIDIVFDPDKPSRVLIVDLYCVS
ncbi:MAG: DUF3592 domain-containing protein [Acidobacteriota bacterium]